MEFLGRMWEFIAETWRVWLVFSVVTLSGYSLWFWLWGQRIYRAVGGKAQIKHGRLGHWQDLEAHLKEDH